MSVEAVADNLVAMAEVAVLDEVPVAVSAILGSIQSRLFVAHSLTHIIGKMILADRASTLEAPTVPTDYQAKLQVQQSPQESPAKRGLSKL